MSVIDNTLGAVVAEGEASPGRIVRHVALFLVLVLVWEAGSRAGFINPLMLPRPTDILRSFYVIFVGTGNVWYHLYVTMTEVVAGFLLGSVVGIALAIFVGLNPVARRFMEPYIVVIQATPRIAVAPLIIAALGFGFTSKITIVMLICFFAPFVNTLSGMLSVNPEALELFRSMRASKWQIFTKLMMPDAAPTIMAGLRLAMSAALTGALVAEFISANEGMGVLLDRYTGSLNMASAFATLLTLTALGFGIFKLMEILDTQLIYWKRDARMAAVSRKRARAWAARMGG